MGMLGKLARGAGRVLPAAALRAASQPAALFFHGVEPATADARIQTNHHEAPIFRRIMARLARDFDVRPLTDIDAVLAAPERFPRAIFLMSDDGYANTATVAADILDALKLPWTLFVSTRHIGGAVPNPIFVARLFFFFAPDGVYRLPHLGQPVSLGTPQTRAAMADGLIDRLRHLPAGQAEESLAAMRAALGEARLTDLIGRFASERFLTWDGVRALKARGVEIGAHADSHWPMHKDQTPDWLHRQASVSRAQIEAAVAPCRFFAYPFGNIGDVGPGAWRAVRDAGFTHAFTTLSGSLAAGGNPMLLPRYGIGPKDTHIASLVPLLRAGNARLRHWQESLENDPAMGTGQG